VATVKLTSKEVHERNESCRSRRVINVRVSVGRKRSLPAIPGIQGTNNIHERKDSTGGAVEKKEKGLVTR